MKLVEFVRFGAAAAAASTIVALAGSASAATIYSVADDFGSSVFSYGQGTGGSSFTPLTVHSACGAGLDCYTSSSGLPEILKNTSASAYNAGTVSIPGNSVDFHPGSATSGDDAIIRFTAPTAGAYHISGSFFRNDNTGNGNGTVASIWENVGGSASALFSTTLASNSYGSSTSFGTLVETLGAGDTIDFVLNNNGDYTFDSTGITATLTAGGVPEPATWAMMLLGFGGLGAMLRAHRREDRKLQALGAPAA